MQRLQPVRVPHLIGAGLRVAAPLDPLDARPNRRPREPRSGRVRALSDGTPADGSREGSRS